MSKMKHSEINSLLALSARIGRNPLLVQASSGNTSVKLGQMMWIKASGRWLAEAEQDEILVPIDLEEAARSVGRGTDVCGSRTTSAGVTLRASIETAMHSVLPQRVVVHVHSVNTIAWAVRQDARNRLAERLAGLRWRWIRYVQSGLPLAHDVQECVSSAPDTNVFVLGNHGLVVCGESSDACQELLQDVEHRLTAQARPQLQPDYTLLRRLIADSPWRLPDCDCVHSLGTDLLSARIVSSGVLYPCQAIFLADSTSVVSPQYALNDVSPSSGHDGETKSFLIIEGAGVVVSEHMTRAESEMLVGLAEIARRIDPSAPLRYLSAIELNSVMTEDSHRYRQLATVSPTAGVSL